MDLKNYVFYYETELSPNGVIQTYDTYGEALQAQVSLFDSAEDYPFCVGCSYIFERDIFLRYGARFSSLCVGSPAVKKIRSIS